MATSNKSFVLWFIFYVPSSTGLLFWEQKCIFYEKFYCMQYVTQRRTDVYISCPYFSSLHLNIAILTSPLLSSRCRDLFLDKDWTKGERPVSTETAVLLYGGRSYHPFWRNQVRRSAFIYQNDWELTKNISASLCRFTHFRLGTTCLTLT